MPSAIFFIILVPATLGIIFWIAMFVMSNAEDMESAAVKKIIDNNARISGLEKKDKINALKLSKMSGIERALTSLFLTADSSAERNKLKETNKKIQNGNFKTVNIFVLPGYSVMRIFNVFQNGRIYKEMFINNAELFGRKNAEKNAKHMIAGMISYAIIGLSFVLCIGALISAFNAVLGAGAAGIGFILAGVLVYAMYDDVTSKVAKRKDEIKRDFPAVVSKLAILVSSGMIMARAWQETADSNFSLIYNEMKTTSDELEQNISPDEAYGGFITRCNTKETSKLASAILQNLSKGNAEIAEHLRVLSKESWEERKHYAKREAEKASAKLIIPTMLLFVSVMIIIMVPIAMSFSGL